MKNVELKELPKYARDFLIYMDTIKNKSQKTIHEYFYDIRVFLKFIYIELDNLYDDHSIENITNENLNEIDISTLSIDIVNKIDLSDLYSYMSYVSSIRENSANARARKVASIKSFFNYLHKKARIIDNNPASELESPKIMKQLPKYLTLDESKKLLNSIDGKNRQRDYAIITLFLNCGLRVSELCSINISNIKEASINILGKGSKERTVYLNKACVNAIENYLRVRPSDNLKDRDALFISERKQRISVKTVQYLVKKYIKKAGLDPNRYSCHKLRHTAATLMYKHGNVDIRSLQEILGHESIQTTEIYTHIGNKELKNAADRNPLSSVIDDNIGKD